MGFKDRELSVVRPSHFISCTTSKGGLVQSVNNYFGSIIT